KLGLTLPFGSHALTYRAGTAVARRLMGSGELIGGEEAVKLGVADGLVPEGTDPLQYALELCRSRDFHDRVRQVSILRQYGRPIGALAVRRVRTCVGVQGAPGTRGRLRHSAREGGEGDASLPRW